MKELIKTYLQKIW